MAARVGQHGDDTLLVERCLAGDADALDQLRRDHLEPLRYTLINKGATPTQAEDLVADLWTDCVVGRPDRPPLLERFNGRASFKNWLFRVGINALIDRLRRQSKQTDLPVPEPEQGGDPYDFVASPERPPAESGLVALLRGSLERSFSQCAADGLLMLRLVYLHGLSQRELAAMWGCHEATISRTLTGAMESIAEQTLQQIQAADPRLKLSWEDILELCQAEALNFI